MQKNERILCRICLAILLLMSPFLICETSPLYGIPNADNAIFLSMGRGIADGLVPYVDVSENKGPLFFALMAIPQLCVQGTVGVYVLEALMLLAYCRLLMELACRLIPQRRHPLALLLPVMWCVWRYGGQNFCEEYDRFFTLIGVTVMVRTCVGQTKGEKWYAFLLGVCTAAVLLIKMSDLVTLGVTALFYLWHAAHSGKSVRREALRFLGGLLTVCVPVCVWLACCGAVGAMLREYFLSNVVHVAVGKGAGFWEGRLYLLGTSYGRRSLLPPAMMALALLISRALGGKRDGLLRGYAAAVALSTLLIAYVAASGFSQHLMLGQLTEVLALMLLLRAITQRLERNGRLAAALRGSSVAAGIACAAFLLCWGVGLADEPFGWTEETQSRLAYLTEFQEDVQDSESVYTIGVTPQWYWHNGVQPAYRYYNLRGFVEDNVGVGLAEEFEAWLMADPVETWVIAGDMEDYRGILTDDTIEFLYNNYEYYSEDSEGVFKLFRLI